MTSVMVKELTNGTYAGICFVVLYAGEKRQLLRTDL